MNNNKTKQLTETALMAALVFAATYVVRIPNPLTSGYSHMGDCMIFLAVLFLGRRNGAAAGALGAALSDLLAGAAVWILPTMIIKYALAFIAGTIIAKDPGSRTLQVAGAVGGGLFQIVGYTLVKVVLFGTKPALASVPALTIQTGIGIVLFFAISAALLKSRYFNVYQGRQNG